MAEFISSFITGFQDVVAEDLPVRLPGIKIINVYDGLIHYKYSGNSRDLEKIIYFNNTFFVLKTFNGKNGNFPAMVGAVCNQKNYFLITKGSFRVRFQNENQFEKVDKNVSKRAEDYVANNSKLKVDRVSPSTEIWFSKRRDGFAFCGQLISKREFTEKNLNKGELRPEIAYLICCFAGLKNDDVIAEPFCGYGSIPVQLAKKFRFSKLFVSDIDEEKINMVSQKKQLKDNENIVVKVCDAMKLDYIADKSLDVVISDPPWGFFEEIGDISLFYENMLKSLLEKIKDEGKIIILSARKEEFEAVCKKMNLQIVKTLHTLVNGKKASLYNLKK